MKIKQELEYLNIDFMLPSYLMQEIVKDDLIFKNIDQKKFVLPQYHSETHYLDLTTSGYFQALIYLRHHVKIVSDYYFSVECGAKNIDLFMLTPSVSSPMGPGSDSEAIPIQFGKYASNLVDSSQFGFEPILLNGIEKVYCYMPSMRGEDPDKRHLNQFFHCEAEIRGGISDLIPLVENYVKILSYTLISLPNILQQISLASERSLIAANRVLQSQKFPVITFDRAISTLVQSGYGDFVRTTPFGRDLTSEGELKIAEILGFVTPFWITHYDRDRVPFYQKPVSEGSSKVFNADLIFPPIIEGSFGGEIVGCGQRQDNVDEMYESLFRQGIDSEVYEWYINLRRQKGYQITSGFGLGVERFITWILCRDDIKNSILYPRLKNQKTYP